MPQTNSTFRIFVSSTFSDLKQERDALQKMVFPRLRDLCRAHGARFQAIDLRWGISQDASEDQQTIKICLNEIDRCRTITHRPNFILLLGDRYGWRPLPNEIPAEEFEQIEAYLHNIKEDSKSEILLQWYKPDYNAVPLVYYLLPRRDNYEDYACWHEIELELYAVLCKATAELKFTSEQRLKYISSATEQEVSHRGLFNRYYRI